MAAVVRTKKRKKGEEKGAEDYEQRKRQSTVPKEQVNKGKLQEQEVQGRQGVSRHLAPRSSFATHLLGSMKGLL
eukprot:1154778-Pelagomonas_calceolata.AAC.5